MGLRAVCAAIELESEMWGEEDCIYIYIYTREPAIRVDSGSRMN